MKLQDFLRDSVNFRHFDVLKKDGKKIILIIQGKLTLLNNDLKGKGAQNIQKLSN